MNLAYSPPAVKRQKFRSHRSSRTCPRRKQDKAPRRRATPKKQQKTEERCYGKPTTDVGPNQLARPGYRVGALRDQGTAADRSTSSVDASCFSKSASAFSMISRWRGFWLDWSCCRRWVLARSKVSFLRCASAFSGLRRSFEEAPWSDRAASICDSTALLSQPLAITCASHRVLASAGSINRRVADDIGPQRPRRAPLSPTWERPPCPTRARFWL